MPTCRHRADTFRFYTKLRYERGQLYTPPIYTVLYLCIVAGLSNKIMYVKWLYVTCADHAYDICTTRMYHMFARSAPSPSPHHHYKCLLSHMACSTSRQGWYDTTRCLQILTSFCKIMTCVLSQYKTICWNGSCPS